MGRGEWMGAREHPVVSVESGRTLLRVGGVIQSVAVDERYEPDVWDAMLPTRTPANALILGLGGGTIATLLTRRFGPVPTVGVERDPRIARLARESFGLDGLRNVQVEIDDAFGFLGRCQVRFDLVCVDLYVAGKMEHGVLAPAALRHIDRVLAPEGEAVFNIWSSRHLPDQMRRIQRVLAVEGISEVAGNVIVRCGHRRFVTVLPAMS
ncbi:MAG TPA: methyltransferase domain-containing protein [Ktedonobacterales bacterium]